jgi:hypothetical protein
VDNMVDVLVSDWTYVEERGRGVVDCNFQVV